MFFSLAEVTQFLIQYKYAFFFPAAVIEGPIVTIMAGFLASLGYFNPWVLFLVALAGDIGGDIIYFIIGRWGGRHFVVRWGKYIGVTEVRLEALDGYFQKHGLKILIFAKTQALGSAILVSAGVVKMPFMRFVAYNLIGGIPKTAILQMVGYFFGQWYALIDRSLWLFGLAAFAIGIAIYFVQRKTPSVVGSDEQ